MVLILISIILYSFSVPALAQSNSVEKIEVAFLYQFGQKIDWPKQDSFENFKIHYVGNSTDIIESLITLAQYKKIKNLPISVSYSKNISKIPQCQILLVEESLNSSFSSISGQLSTKNTLIVSENLPNDDQAMINFILSDEGKLNIKVNTPNLTARGLSPHDDLKIYGGTDSERGQVFSEWKSNLNSALDSLETEKSKVKAYEEQVSLLKKEIQTTQTALESLHKQVELSRKTITEQKRKILLQEAETIALSNKLAELTSELNQKLARIEEEEVKIKELENRLYLQVDKISKNDSILESQIKTIELQGEKIKATNEVVREQDITIEQQRLIVGISIIVIGIILGLGFLLWRAYRIKEEALTKIKSKNEEILLQRSQLEAQAEELRAINDQIIDQKTEIEKTLNELQSTQSQLVLAEKMAILGKTAANVAHEINTPLGAINSSAENILSFYEQFIRSLQRLAPNLTAEMLNSLFEIILAPIHDQENLSTREMRSHRRKLTAELTPKYGEDAREISELLVEAGYTHEIESLTPILEHKNGREIIRTARDGKQLLLNNKNILTAVQRASKIIVTLKSYAGKSKIQIREKVNLKENIITVLTIYHNKLRSFVVKKEFPNLNKELHGYADELGQVWTNLIHNAMHAMESGGIMEISYEELEESVIVRVTDDGTGIPASIQNRIFEPLFTTKSNEEGTGLGLDIVKKIIEKHNGSITFDSTEGVGTTFKVELPLI